MSSRLRGTHSAKLECTRIARSISGLPASPMAMRSRPLETHPNPCQKIGHQRSREPTHDEITQNDRATTVRLEGSTGLRGKSRQLLPREEPSDQASQNAARDDNERLSEGQTVLLHAGVLGCTHGFILARNRTPIFRSCPIGVSTTQPTPPQRSRRLRNAILGIAIAVGLY